MTSIFFKFVYKTCEKELTVLKPCRLIVHLKFYKICKFVNHVTRNDVIMTSLLKAIKTMGKCGNRRNQTKYISFEMFWGELLKMWFLLHLSHCVKVIGIYYKFTKALTKYSHVTWSCLQFPKIFIFWLILYLILGKFTKFGGNWLKNKRVTGKKNWRWKRSPVLIGLEQNTGGKLPLLLRLNLASCRLCRPRKTFNFLIRNDDEVSCDPAEVYLFVIWLYIDKYRGWFHYSISLHWTELV